MTIGNGIDNIWLLDGNAGNITGIYLGLETNPFSAGSPAPGDRRERGKQRRAAGYAKAYLDNLRVRKRASPDPTAKLEAERSTCAE